MARNKVEVIVSTKDAASGALEKIGRSLSSIATIAKVTAVALVGVGATLFKISTNFNKAMANVATLIPGNIERINALKNSVQSLAVEVGKSTTDLAEGLFQVISAFGDASDTAEKLRITAKAATAGLATTTEALNLLSAVTKGYGDTSAEALKKVSDLAFTTNKLGQTTFPELAASMGRVVPFAAKLGQSQEELFAIFATLTGVTGNAAEVSTQMAAIQKALIKPTIDMAKAIKALGFESTTALVEQEGLVGAMQKLIATTDGSEQAIGKLFGRAEALTAVFALNGAQADSFTQKLGAMREAAGATNEAFNEQAKGINELGFQWEQIKQKAITALQDIGDALAPVFSKVLDVMDVFFSNFATIFIALPSIVQMSLSTVSDLMHKTFTDFDFFKGFLVNAGRVAIALIKGWVNMLVNIAAIVVKFAAILWTPLGTAFDVIKSVIRFSFESFMKFIQSSMIKTALILANQINTILPERFEFDTSGLGKKLNELNRAAIEPAITMEEAFESTARDVGNIISSMGDNIGDIKDGFAATFDVIKRAAKSVVALPEVQALFENIESQLKEAEGVINEFSLNAGDAIKKGLLIDEESQGIFFETWDGLVEHVREKFITIQDIANTTWDMFQEGFGNAVAQMIVNGESFSSIMDSVFKSILTNFINMLAQMILQQIVFGVASKGIALKDALTWVFATAGKLFMNIFNSIAAIPVIGPFLAPALAAAGVVAAIGGAKKLIGQAHDGLTKVPREGTFLLDQGERVVSAEQNKDLVDFMQNGGIGGGGVNIGTLNIMPNASITEALLNAPREFWINLTTKQILPALNELGEDGRTTTVRFREANT